MKIFSVILLLVVVSVTSAVPFGFYSGRNSAVGQAGSNLVTGISGGPYQHSQITQLSSNAAVRWKYTPRSLRTLRKRIPGDTNIAVINLHDDSWRFPMNRLHSVPQRTRG